MAGHPAMEKELAREIIIAAYRSGSYLGSLMPTLKQHCTETEYAPPRQAIPRLLTDINDTLAKHVYALYPELEGEIGDHIEKFGQLT
jgi:hypothetical protein